MCDLRHAKIGWRGGREWGGGGGLKRRRREGGNTRCSAYERFPATIAVWPRHTVEVPQKVQHLDLVPL